MRTREEVQAELLRLIDRANHCRLELVAIEYGLEGWEPPSEQEAETAKELTDELTAFIRPLGAPITDEQRTRVRANVMTAIAVTSPGSLSVTEWNRMVEERAASAERRPVALHNAGFTPLRSA